jgi:mannose-6-phosphate isomerase-like protein (cupin superfamily)
MRHVSCGGFLRSLAAAKEGTMKHVINLRKLVKENENFRKVLLTGKQSQLVAMHLAPGDEIGEEIHPTIDQMFVVEDGRGELILDGKLEVLEENVVAFAPAGTRHNIRNSGKKPLKLFTIYAPPVHAPDAVEKAHHKLAT